MLVSGNSLISSTILFCVTIYSFSLLFVALIGMRPKDEWPDQETLIYSERFESVYASLHTLIRIFAADDAFGIIWPLVKDQLWLLSVFLLYISLQVPRQKKLECVCMWETKLPRIVQKSEGGGIKNSRK